MLDEYENKLEKELEAGNFVEVDNQDEYEKIAKEAAANFLKKSERINIRLSVQDLQRIRAIAAEEGLPYQTLASSVLHKFAKNNFNGNDAHF